MTAKPKKAKRQKSRSRPEKLAASMLRLKDDLLLLADKGTFRLSPHFAG